jgi:hypothetical protein
MAVVSTGSLVVCGLAMAGALFLLWVLYHFVLESRQSTRARITINIVSLRRRI